MSSVQTTVANTECCCFKVALRPKNVAPEWDNLGSELLMGSDAKSWDLATRKHKSGYLGVYDRMTYDENPSIGGIAPLKPGICLEKAIRVKKDTLWQLA